MWAFLSIAKNNDKKPPYTLIIYSFPSIVLSNAINKIVVLLTAESSNNNIQYKYKIVFIEWFYPFIVHKKGIYLHHHVHWSPTTATLSQVVHAANRKRQWYYSLAKWQIVLTLIATTFECPKRHKMTTTIVTNRCITMINPCTKG